MKSILVISDSVEGSEYDLKRSILTIKDSNLDPLSVVPTIFEYGGNAISTDTSEIIEYVFSNQCDFDAACIGFLTDENVVKTVSGHIGQTAGIKDYPVICAPSLISSAGEILVSEDVYYAVCDYLLPKADILVINDLEAELLCEFECPNRTDYQRAARKISTTYGCTVLIKSSIKTEGKNLLFSGSSLWLEDPIRIPEGSELKYNLMTSIACCLSQRRDITGAVRNAIRFYASGLTAKEHIEIKLSETGSRVTEYGTDDSVEAIPPALLIEDDNSGTPTLDNFVPPKEEISLPDFENILNTEAEPAPVPAPAQETAPTSASSLSVPEQEMREKLTVNESVAPVRRPNVRLSGSYTPVPHISSGSLLGGSIRGASSTTTTSSLVSPVKSIRDIARRLETDHRGEEETPPAVTSTIEKPEPGPKAPVSELKRTAVDLQSLRERLNKLSGTGNI